MKNHFISRSISLTLVGLHLGCTTTQRITTRSQLADPLQTGTLIVLTKDGSQVELPEYRLKDSTLVGRGSSEKDGIKTPFDGSLKLTDIRYAKTQNASVGKTLISLGALVFFSATAISYLGANEGLSVREQDSHYYPPS